MFMALISSCLEILNHQHQICTCFTQVLKTGVTHYFSIEKARGDFGYDPEPRTLEGVVRWFRERGHGRRSTSVTKKFLIHFLLLLTVFVVVMSFLPMVM